MFGMGLGWRSPAYGILAFFRRTGMFDAQGCSPGCAACPTWKAGTSKERGVHAGEGPCICQNGDRGGPKKCLAWRRGGDMDGCKDARELLVANTHRWVSVPAYFMQVRLSWAGASVALGVQTLPKLH